MNLLTKNKDNKNKESRTYEEGNSNMSENKLIDLYGQVGQHNESGLHALLNDSFSDDIEKAVVTFAKEYPKYGQIRVSKELSKRGIAISPGEIRHIWLRHNLQNMGLRLKALEEKSARDNVVHCMEKGFIANAATYKAILNSSTDGFVIIDKEKMIRAVNDSYCKMLGYNQEELLQMSIEAVEASMSPGELHHHFNNVAVMGKAVFETQNRCKDGSLIDVEISVNLLGNDDLQFAFVRNRTYRKQMERDLHTANNDNLQLIRALEEHQTALELKIDARIQELKKSYDLQQVISTLLKLSFKRIGVKEFLDLSLDLLFSLPWFTIRSIGSIFLYDEAAGVLKMAASKNFPKQLITQCTEVRIGRCLCGLAALRKELVFKECTDSDHEITYEDMPRHGHYCAPIIFRDKVLGVLNVDVEEGHRRDNVEERLILMFADTLASTIQRKTLDEKVEYMTNFDVLTGLPNRTLLIDRLTQSAYQSKRYKDKTAVMYLDLDDFKPINDKYGHDIGDAVLKSISERLRHCLRDTDTVSRLGGDEFAIVTRGFASSHELVELCNRIISEVKKPIEYKGNSVYVNASIGISICPDDGAEAKMLLKKADTAMHKAKTLDDGTFIFYNNAMDKELNEKRRLEEDLRHALSSDQLILHYQPQIDMTTDNVIGVEALIRWAHPTLGMIYPDSFIPLAEETGLIVELGKLVVKRACQQNMLWHSEGLPLMNIAVNVAPVEFKQCDFVENILNILIETKMDPNCLELEITERTSIEDVELTIDVMHTLNSAGVKVSLDDFGTAYSSLNYLRRLPFSKIKIDKSFVMDINHNHDALIIVKTIIDMSHNLRKPVIAEGVETREHLEILKGLGCDEGQGYLFSKPMSAKDFMEFAGGKAAGVYKTLFSV